MAVWISVLDKLPPDGGSYWVYYNGVVDEGWYFPETQTFDAYLEDFPEVTHWRKIIAPEPPEEEV